MPQNMYDMPRKRKGLGIYKAPTSYSLPAGGITPTQQAGDEGVTALDKVQLMKKTNKLKRPTSLINPSI